MSTLSATEINRKFSEIEKCIIELASWRKAHEELANIKTEQTARIISDLSKTKQSQLKTEGRLDVIESKINNFIDTVKNEKDILESNRRIFYTRASAIIVTIIISLVGFSVSWGGLKEKVMQNKVNIELIKKEIHE